MVKKEIIWSPQAKLEQYQILDFYFERNGNKIYSEKLYLIFREAIELIRVFPQIGIQSDIKDVYICIRGDFSIFYKNHAESIEILSIWDNRQNPQKNKLFNL